MQRLFLPSLTLVVLVLILYDRLAQDRPGSVPVPPRPTQSVETDLPARTPPAARTELSADLSAPTIDRLARLATRRALSTEGKATYLDSLLLSTDSVLRRWPAPLGRPLRLALVENDPSGKPDRISRHMREAVRRWDALGLELGFEFIADTVAADVVVRWITRFPIDRTGQTDLTWDHYGRVQRAVITLATADAQGRNLPGPALLSVAIHEMGHALGLPHSSDPADVMFPEPRITELSPRDRRTVQVLYLLPSGSVKDSLTP
jgi:Matrixin